MTEPLPLPTPASTPLPAPASLPGGWARAGRRAGIAGAAIGVLAAGAAAGVAVERLAMGRGVRRRARQALDAAGPYGTLRGTPGTAVADDGTELYYEVEDAEDFPPAAPDSDGTAVGTPAARRRRRRFAGRREPAPLTVVFSHGYCLTQDSWHFQRAALRGHVRTVYWDQRSHGRSARGISQLAGDEPVTIEQLGRDLKAVLDAAAPEGRLLLVGHSMGGMTVMAFADQFPDLVRDRVAGVALLDTSAGDLGRVTFGLPAAGAWAVRHFVPGFLKALGSRAELAERGRQATADLFAGIIKHYSFGTEGVDPGVARFAERLLESTPIDVVAEFYPAFALHEKGESLELFRDLPGLVLVGDRDMVTPPAHSERIAARLPDAVFEVVEEAGHLAPLERPDRVNDALAALLARAGVRIRAGAGAEQGARPVRRTRGTPRRTL
ncbi:alpha/beta fold hydrolase [Streptomyces sp. WMMC500]|uniref:alpha/beta fold hydrolase n=1 Tax=Streptomyces sp. WMMC500 TaxID=3015154 RepID=UPI00248B7362|nr:alpha/beta fold hydrolase [Streptomyces sp. WMMC500]WBB63701.1 alpha/beta fold hydrolase [Streptomyces sp. WMMC500]